MRSSGSLRVAEVLDADVLAGMERLGDAAGDGIQFDADEAHAPGCPWLMKLPVPQPGSRIVALAGTPRRAMASWMAAMTVGEV